MSDSDKGQIPVGRLLSPSMVTFALLVLVIVSGAVTTSGFVSWRNLEIVLSDILAPGLLALGASIAMHGGVADLSIASTLGFGGMAFAYTFAATTSLWQALVTALAVGIVAGLVNATVSVRYGVMPLIATLGMFVAGRGATRVIGSGRSVGAYDPALNAMVNTTAGPIPIAIIVLTLLVVMAWWWITQTRPGRHIVAVGGDEEASARAGIPVGRVRVVLFLCTGVLAAVAGVVQVVRIGSAPVNLGEGLELQVYAALLIAGYRLQGGGSGNPLGGLVALVALGLLLSIFRLGGLPVPLRDLMLGIALLLSVILELVRGRVARPVTVTTEAGLADV